MEWLCNPHLLKGIHDPRMLKHGWFPEVPTLGTLASQLLQFLLDPRRILGTDPVGLGAAVRCLVIPLCSASHLTIVLGLLPSFLGYFASTRPDLIGCPYSFSHPCRKRIPTARHHPEVLFRIQTITRNFPNPSLPTSSLPPPAQSCQ